jgi:pyruvate dehydrogenase E1 component
VNTKGPPTVILAKTVKGFGLGKVAEGQMVAHQQKKLDMAAVRELRDRFNIPGIGSGSHRSAVRKPAPDSDEMRYLQTHRKHLGGYLPQRKPTAPPLTVPPLEAFRSILEGTAEREISTTMAFVRILTVLLKDKGIGKHIVPIVPDEARTFGMEGLFRQIGIYSAVGQLYTPVDAETLMSYREDRKGQMLEEGINEAGSTCSWIAAATSYANHGISMVPFYVYYSMFGFQRVGDFIWAAGDMRARGFLVGATAGRTTLAGEGLQHQDGHSQLVATTIPNCRAYDPTYAYELAVIIQDGMQRMYVQNESVFYYISVMNENYAQPALPAGAEGGHRQGRLPAAERRRGQAARDAAGQRHDPARMHRRAELLEQQFGVMTDVFSITSFSELRREALECERWNLLHPADAPRVPYVQTLLAGREGALVAATDYVRNVPDQIRRGCRSRT